MRLLTIIIFIKPLFNHSFALPYRTDRLKFPLHRQCKLHKAVIDKTLFVQLVCINHRFDEFSVLLRTFLIISLI
jgi:hypothetical protein